MFCGTGGGKKTGGGDKGALGVFTVAGGGGDGDKRMHKWPVRELQIGP